MNGREGKSYLSHSFHSYVILVGGEWKCRKGLFVTKQRRWSKSFALSLDFIFKFIYIIFQDQSPEADNSTWILQMTEIRFTLIKFAQSGAVFLGKRSSCSCNVKWQQSLKFLYFYPLSYYLKTVVAHIIVQF